MHLLVELGEEERARGTVKLIGMKLRGDAGLTRMRVLSTPAAKAI